MLHWLRQWSARLSRSAKPTARATPERKRLSRFRPSVELLEERSVPAGLPFIHVGVTDLLPMVFADSRLPGLADRVGAALPQVTFNLAPLSDTGQLGDLRTNLASVILLGQTVPGGSVHLLNTGTVTTADANGRFALDNVPLPGGTSTFTIQVTSPAGYIGQEQMTFSRGAVVNHRLANVTVMQDAENTLLNLDSLFRDPDAVLTHSIVHYKTVLGDFDVELFDTKAPLTVANFLKYVNDGDYHNSIFHRHQDNHPKVLQGGGFTFVGNGLLPAAITPDAPVRNEYGIPNTLGTIAMAKLGGHPNSATSQFFFNLEDNSTFLDPTNNGGFTVFGKVLGDGMDVVDDLASIPIRNTNIIPFDKLPLINLPTAPFPGDAVKANYALVNDIVLSQRRDGMTFSVVGNTHRDVVIASISGSTLTLDYGAQGTAVITIQATDRDGATTQTTFSVTVEGP